MVSSGTDGDEFTLWWIADESLVVLAPAAEGTIGVDTTVVVIAGTQYDEGVGGVLLIRL